MSSRTPPTRSRTTRTTPRRPRRAPVAFAGDDAHDTAHSRVQAVYELLDTVGWSVLGEPARQEGGE